MSHPARKQWNLEHELPGGGDCALFSYCRIWVDFAEPERRVVEKGQGKSPELLPVPSFSHSPFASGKQGAWRILSLLLILFAILIYLYLLVYLFLLVYFLSNVKSFLFCFL